MYKELLWAAKLKQDKTMQQEATIFTQPTNTTLYGDNICTTSEVSIPMLG